MDKTIKELRSCNRDYNPEKFQRCIDLIDGGDSFVRNIDKYQTQRNVSSERVSPQVDLEVPFPADWHGTAWGSEQNSKKRWYHYVPHCAGLFDAVSAATSDDPVKLYVS